jgi:anti-sigma factor ChrR (cupin superfamily)
MLKEFGVQLTNRKVAEARRRAGLVDLTNPGKKSNLPKLKARGFTIAQWEDDGGAVQLS